MAGTITHEWNGTILTITSDSGTTAMDLKGEKGDTGARGARGLPGKAGGGARIEDGVISDETTWSSSGIIDRFAELMGTNANPAVLDNPYPNFPLQITTTFESKQSGTGEPSPDNVRPISGFNSAKLTRCGKNLLKNTATTQTVNGITFTVNSDGTVKANGTATATAILTLVSSTSNPELRDALLGNKITISGCPSGGSSTTYDLRIFQYADANTYLLDYGSGKTATFTNAELPFNVAILIRSGVKVNNLVFRPQIELGSVATAYEPYRGDTFTIVLGDTYYGGTLDWNTGVLTVDKAIRVFDGTEAWQYTTSDVARFGTSTLMGEALGSLYASSHFKATNSIADAQQNGNGITIYDTGYIDIVYPSISNLDDFKSFLSAQYTAGTPVQVCYKLATPTTIQLTQQEIKAIKGINTLYSNAQELTVIGRVDTMYQLSKLAERVAALESR